MSTHFNQTVSHILSLFNHTLSDSDREEIFDLFLMVEHGDYFDCLAKNVLSTLHEKIIKFDEPFCSVKQAKALAVAIEGKPKKTIQKEI